ncbi:MAG: DUF3465 domain-containing protein [Candidatus Eremiobacteraeota bacterium]|nr:DUF3465 domain-containing protein [Candidatus Eremiobacteraeota bacterium]
MTLSAAAAVRDGRPCELQFSGTVTDRPQFFYGRHSHAEHEAFHVRSEDGVTVDVVDNVTLATPGGGRAGDRVTVRGEFVPAERGPLVHWTHHDPAGRHAAGFIEWNGRRYA